LAVTRIGPVTVALQLDLDLGVTEVSKIDSTWDKSDSKST